jgi:hypothetical protein
MSSILHARLDLVAKIVSSEVAENAAAAAAFFYDTTRRRDG